MIIKRIMDIFIALMVLLVLLIPGAIVALLVRLKMGSPVFFCQNRPGKSSEMFGMMKFRTMTNSRDANGNLHPDSIRLTPFGRFLRRYSIDELPQIFNVLKGDMSIVGPRPLLASYLPYLTPRESTRHNVQPGITGLAQIAGRNTVAWDDRLELDAVYVENMSVKQDIIILLKTVLLVLKRTGVQEDTAAEGNLAELRSGMKGDQV